MRNKKMQNILEKFRVESPKECYIHISQVLNEKRKRFVITANPEIVMMAYQSSDLAKICCREDTELIPDGIGVVYALKHLLKRKDIQRNTGIDFVSFLLKYADANNSKIFIYGAKEDVLETFLRKCRVEYPSIKVVGAYNGYSSDRDEIVSAAINSNADIFLIALGTPKQEFFIESIYKELAHGVCVGIGGSIDVLSGHTNRAPVFFINYNLEWLYRVLREPKRIRRFIKSNCIFVIKTML